MGIAVCILCCIKRMYAEILVWAFIMKREICPMVVVVVLSTPSLYSLPIGVEWCAWLTASYAEGNLRLWSWRMRCRERRARSRAVTRSSAKSSVKRFLQTSYMKMIRCSCLSWFMTLYMRSRVIFITARYTRDSWQWHYDTLYSNVTWFCFAFCANTIWLFVEVKCKKCGLVPDYTCQLAHVLCAILTQCSSIL